MKRILLSLLCASSLFTATAQNDVFTHRQYLSGKGCDDMVNWDFFCSDGNNSGKWTKIGVPSCWETQGFGTYQYGMRFYGKPRPEGIAKEQGIYKYEFNLPESWKGRQILLVFEASMTDTYAEINGRKAGNKHHGGFYRFTYDVSDRIFFGKHKNSLKVTVDKESENDAVNMAERRADYWNFGGIIRPVFIISKPANNIDRVAIDARMDGRFIADCYLNRAFNGSKVRVAIKDEKGKTVGTSESPLRGSDNTKFDFKVNNPRLWTAETPNRYTAEFTLLDANGKAVHVERQKFGFRTIEYRKSDGVYINGKKVIFKGVNRHSFRPESGRTLSKAKNIEDVNLIKSMNMNAVRLSHYPADPEFLDACDSLGLYVESELSGWHWAHETIIGQQLVKEMVTRDVNHPSIIFWSNGNEGGFNYELEPEFSRWDIQNRVVLYPWGNRNGFETKHYRSWGETLEYMRKPEIFMPTEFLHGLYDGGHGAGLADYWEIMMKNPRCAGGFLWDLADEGVKRVDMNGIIDNVGNFGADGIVGPHFEKEGSYYTIKEIWSPVQLKFNGNKLIAINHYDFTNLNTVSLKYQYLQMPVMGGKKETVLKSGTIKIPSTLPHDSCVISLPQAGNADALRLTATDKSGHEIFTWSKKIAQKDITLNKAKYNVTESADEITVDGEDRTYHFSKKNGMLQGVDVKGKHISLTDGPRFIAARRADRSFDQFYNHDDIDAEKKKTQYTEYEDQGVFDGISVNKQDGNVVLTAKYKLGSLDSAQWTFLNDGKVALKYAYKFGGIVDEMGVMFQYPEEKVLHKTWVGNGPYRVWQNRRQGPQYGLWENDYNDPIPAESFTYPEFKGYFENVTWMQLDTKEGKIGIALAKDNKDYVGIYQPRDGRDHILYDLPKTGISLLQVIPAVRNKVNTTDLNGPSAQPFRSMGDEYTGTIILSFE
jgi:beta-galactosidase/beta-glucuronidase